MRFNLCMALLLAGLAVLQISAVSVIHPTIDLIDFSISNTEKKVTITWATGFEQDVNNFYIERAINDGEFKKLGTVKAKGNTTNKQEYSFRDQFSDGFAGKAYYRLMLQDSEGHCSKSIKRSVTFR